MSKKNSRPDIDRERNAEALRLHGIPASVAENTTVRYQFEGKAVEVDLGEFLSALRETIISL